MRSVRSVHDLYDLTTCLLVIPDDGITGEVHQNMGFKIDNDYGNLVKKGTEKQNDDEFDIQSELSNMTPANIMRRKTSLKLYQ